MGDYKGTTNYFATLNMSIFLHVKEERREAFNTYYENIVREGVTLFETSLGEIGQSLCPF